LRARYLDLLKRSLTDYAHVDSGHANAMPLEWLAPKSPLKGVRDRALTGLARRFGYSLGKGDRLDAAERARRRRGGADWPPHAHTMIGLARLDNIQMAIETALADGVPGDLVETGVWRGGAAIFMRAVLLAHGVEDRTIWACDSFAGLPPPDPERYPSDAGDRHHTVPFLAVGVDQVRANFEKYDLLDDKVRFVEGYFEDTLAGLPAERVALLRLDGDMYASTTVALEALYERLSPGGFAIVDDYHLGPCRQAVDDFRRAHAVAEEIVDIDGLAAYWRKG
jgi:O-methyltransferase